MPNFIKKKPTFINLLGIPFIVYAYNTVIDFYTSLLCLSMNWITFFMKLKLKTLNETLFKLDLIPTSFAKYLNILFQQL